MFQKTASCKQIFVQGRYAAALFSAANKNGSLEAVEKVVLLHFEPEMLKHIFELLLVTNLKRLFNILAQDTKVC